VFFKKYGLSVLAAVIHVTAYAIYLRQIFGGGSIPNPASWTIWAGLSILNALTFWKGSRDALATAQFFTGSVACFIVWAFALGAGKFAPLDAMAWTVLVLCIAACAVWYLTNAVYASIAVGVILLVSSVPTIAGVWRNGSIEQPLPWYMWTAAFAITAVNVFWRTDRTKPRWWFLMVVPITGIVIHGVVAIGAGR
jgi:hypothetical protein